MYTYVDFEKITLLSDEIRLLKHISRKGSVPFSNNMKLLYEDDYLVRNYSDMRDAFNAPIPDGTVSISDKAKRYLVYLKRRTIERFITPVIVSAITTTVLYTLQHSILPGVLSWVSDLLLWFQTYFSTIQK